MRSIRILLVGYIIIALIGCSRDGDTMFELIPADKSGIDFNNIIADNDTLNILTYEYIYNGGGVALADFDNDGLKDVFFSGNIVSNRLYRNLGDFKFEDITESSNTAAPDSWCSGIAIVDINQDGYQDIYICANTKKEGAKRKNLLFINEYGSKNRLEFKEVAAEYGIADSSYSTNSAFFDYDNDGDLDLFIVNNHLKKSRHSITYSYRAQELVKDQVDRLYRNDGLGENGHPVFADVTDEAGIDQEGYSLGLNITDINHDGWKDIYVTNDFLSNDLLYINNQDGTFSNKAKEYLKHSSHSAMGIDIADINNDALQDIITVDMLPESNYRKKTMMGPTNYTAYIYAQTYDYIQQYVRNVLQVHQGKIPNTEDVAFSEVAMVSGIEGTDWSWAPLLADFDQDGYRDLIITNGFPKDITDQDFMAYQSSVFGYVENSKMLKQIPEVKISNYAYKNAGNFQFDDVTKDWGLSIPSFANGAAYGDLDNDGDLDLIMNNINDNALVYRNNKKANNAVIINLIAEKPNRNAIGTVIKYQSDHVNGIYEHTMSRGYLSSVDNRIILGLGKDSIVDLEVTWPNGLVSQLPNQKINELLTINSSGAKGKAITTEDKPLPLFHNMDIAANDTFYELDHIDYNTEPLLLHKLSQYGPGIAVGDVNGDNLDDYYVTGSYLERGILYLQSESGTFAKQKDLATNEISEEQSALFLDIDNDGDQDLYIANGSNQFEKGDKHYKDALFRNDNGVLINISDQLNLPSISTGCVRAADYDKDGDLDLFIGARSTPWEYPMPATSYILENKSTGGKINLEYNNSAIAPSLDGIGMVSDAIWTDFNNDGWQDLILAGEWMPLTFLQNNEGKFVDATNSTGIGDVIGWWNSIVSADYDGDGDMDYIAGNYGQNSTIKASDKYPVEIYAKDFDDNGAIDALPFVYYKDWKGELSQVSYHVRSDLAKEMNLYMKRFTSNHNLGIVDIDSILTKKEREGAYHISANELSTSYIENLGEGKFKIKSLPIEAQLAPVYGMIADDIDNDGHADVLLVGNDYGTQPGLGRMDGFNGLFLKGNGTGKFSPMTIEEGGFYIPGDAKALVQIYVGDQKTVIVSQNNNRLLSCAVNKESRVINTESDDHKISLLDINDQVISTKELSYGSGFLSQSSRKISISADVKKVEIMKYNGDSRTINVD